ncbi:hypothetical protein K438DRAFT_1788131 [Mycena galopus ATCC 62051]|nr:hypothetical protein K438DRAFT_1788131 [Mycena galopus ATCC 62051]
MYNSPHLFGAYGRRRGGTLSTIDPLGHAEEGDALIPCKGGFTLIQRHDIVPPERDQNLQLTQATTSLRKPKRLKDLAPEDVIVESSGFQQQRGKKKKLEEGKLAECKEEMQWFRAEAEMYRWLEQYKCNHAELICVIERYQRDSEVWTRLAKRDEGLLYLCQGERKEGEGIGSGWVMTGLGNAGGMKEGKGDGRGLLEVKASRPEDKCRRLEEVRSRMYKSGRPGKVFDKSGRRTEDGSQVRRPEYSDIGRSVKTTENDGKPNNVNNQSKVHDHNLDIL